MMRLSPVGAAVMHHFEQCRLTAYPDPGSRDGNPWTIGWGHTGLDVHKGLVWTQAQADAAFMEDVRDVERAVERMVDVPITQGQFDALVALGYNIGTDALKSSTLMRKLNDHDHDGARAQFQRWNKNDGKVMRGLTRRRHAEAALFAGMDAQAALAAAGVAA